jgi:hypothetical protein
VDDSQFNDEDDDIDSVENTATTWNDAKLAMNTLSKYCTRDSDLLDGFGSFRELLTRYNKQNVKQTTISVFWQ